MAAAGADTSHLIQFMGLFEKFHKESMTQSAKLLIADYNKLLEATRQADLVNKGNFESIRGLMNDLQLESRRAESAENNLGQAVQQHEELRQELKQVKVQLKAEQTEVHKLLDKNVGLSKAKQELLSKLASSEDQFRQVKVAEAQAKADIATSREREHKARQELQAKEEKLGALQNFSKPHKDLDLENFRAQLHNIYQTALDLCSKTFGEAVADDALSNDKLWEECLDLQAVKANIPIPRSNTDAAKRMRVMAALSTLGRSMARNIFRPTFVIFDEGDELRTVLETLFSFDPARESYLRSVLHTVTVSPTKQNKPPQDRKNVVVAEMMSIAQILPAEQQNSLQVGLQRLLKDAWSLSIEMQSVSARISTEIKLEDLPAEFSRALALPVPPSTTRQHVGGHAKAMKPDQTSSGVKKIASRSNMNRTGNNHVDSESSATATADDNDIVGTVWPAFVVDYEDDFEMITPGIVVTSAYTEDAKAEKAKRVQSRRKKTKEERSANSSSVANKRLSFLPSEQAGNTSSP